MSENELVVDQKYSAPEGMPCRTMGILEGRLLFPQVSQGLCGVHVVRDTPENRRILDEAQIPYSPRGEWIHG